MVRALVELATLGLVTPSEGCGPPGIPHVRTSPRSGLCSLPLRSARVLTPDGAAGVVGAEGGIIAEGLQGRGFSEGQCSCGGSSALAGAWRADGALAVQEGGSAGDTRCHGGGPGRPSRGHSGCLWEQNPGRPWAGASQTLAPFISTTPAKARVLDDPQKGAPAGTGGLAVICRASAQNPHSELGRGYWGSEQILAALTKVTEHQVRVTSSVLPVIIPSFPLQSARVWREVALGLVMGLCPLISGFSS